MSTIQTHCNFAAAHAAIDAAEREILLQIKAEIHVTGEITRKEYFLRQALKELKTSRTFLLRTGSAFNCATYVCENE